MNPDQERKAKEKQLRELEEELGLPSRRQLETLISVIRSDIKHAVQFAFSNAYDPKDKDTIAHHQYLRQLKGMQKRSEIVW